MLHLLAGGVAGQGLAPEPVPGGHVEGGQAFSHVAGELVGGHLVPGAEHDDGTDLFAQHGVGHPDDGTVGHRRVLEEGSLHLDAVDVLPAADDHVLGPVDDVHEPLVVDAGHIAGVEPAAGERSGGVLVPVPVAADHVGPLDPQLPGPVGIGGLVGRRLGPPVVVGDHGDIAHRNRGTDTVGLAYVVVAGVHGAHGRCLGQPVAVGGRPHREVLLDPPDQVRWGRGPSIGDAAYGRGVALGEVGRVDDLHDHGGDAAEEGDLLPLDELEGPLGIEVVHHHQLPAGGGVGDQHGVAAGGVEQGHRQQVGVLAAAAHVSGATAVAKLALGGDEEQVHEVGARVAVGAHRPLGPTGDARRVEDGGVVVGLQVDVGEAAVALGLAHGLGEGDHGDLLGNV